MAVAVGLVSFLLGTLVTYLMEGRIRTLICLDRGLAGDIARAEHLHERVESEIDRIVDTQATSSLVRNAFRALFKRTTAIEFAQDPGDYDQVAVVTPFWVGSLPPATRTYLKEHRDRLERFAILSICGRGGADLALLVVQALRRRRQIAHHSAAGFARIRMTMAIGRNSGQEHSPRCPIPFPAPCAHLGSERARLGREQGSSSPVS